jgi:hypothetical protein
MKLKPRTRVATLFISTLALLNSSIYTAQASPAATVTNVLVNKNSFDPGEKIVINYYVTSSEINSSNINQVSLVEESEPDDCGVRCYITVKPKLVSGTIASGSWQAEIILPINFYGGNYNLFIGYIKLSSESLKVLPITISGKPIPRPLIPTANIISYKVNNISFKSGDKIIVDFQITSANLPSGSIPFVSISDENETEGCENYCSLQVKPIIQKGTVLDGSWRATLQLPKEFYGGNYNLFFGYIKILGQSFKIIPIKIDGPAAPVKPRTVSLENLFYTISELKMTAMSAIPGGNISGTFMLETNDPTVSSPECIVMDATDWTRAVRAKGTYMSGSWTCSVQIPNKMPLGNYKLHVAVVGYANNEKNETHEDIGSFSVVTKLPTTVNKSSSNSLKPTTSASILCSKSGTFKYFPNVKTCPSGWVKK